MNRFNALIAMVVLSSVCSVTLSHAQGLPVNTLIKETFKSGDQEQKQKIALPDPLQLNVLWWQFFETKSGAELDKGIAQFTERLMTQLESLPKEEQTALGPVVANIKASFAAYAAFKTRKSDPVEATKLVSAEAYTVDQLISLIHLNRDVSAQVNRSTSEVNDYDKQLKNLRRQIDTLMARYIDMPKDAPERFKEAIMIIGLQVENALIEMRYGIQRTLLSQLTAQKTDVVKHKDIAVERLKSTIEERELLTSKITDTEGNIQIASMRLLREQQSAALVNSNGSNEDIAVVRYRAQRVLVAQVNLSLIEAELLLLYSKKTLLDVIDSGDTLDVETTQRWLTKYDEQLVELRGKHANGLEQNEIERTRSNEILADNGGRSSESLFLTNITQDRSNLVQETSVSLQRLQATIADIDFLSKLTHQILLKHQGVFLHSIAQIKYTLSNSWRYVKTSLKTSLFKIGDTPVTALGFARLVFIIFVAWWLAFWLNKFLIRMGNRGNGDKLPAYYLVGRLTYYSIILIGFLSGLTAIGIDFTNFALVAGALAIGLGFGLQSIVNNFVSGLILLFERSIKVGDFIELQDRNLWGEVKEINVRATIISDNDNVDIIIPNSEFINTKMLNWTLMEPHRRIRYPFKVAYGTNKELVREVVLAAAEEVPHTLKGIPGRNPAVWLRNFGEFYYEFELVVWLTARAVKRPNGVRAAYMWAIDSALCDNNIEIPIPQREHRFRAKTALPIQRYVAAEEAEEESFKNELREAQEDLFNAEYHQ